MTGHGAAEAGAPNPRGRRAQLEMMQALQRRLNDIKSCDCPGDCRAQGRAPAPEQEDDDDDDNDDDNNDDDDDNDNDNNDDDDDDDDDGGDSPEAPSTPPGDTSNGPGNNSGSNTNAPGNNTRPPPPPPPLPWDPLTELETNSGNQNAGPATVKGSGANTNAPGSNTGSNTNAPGNTTRDNGGNNPAPAPGNRLDPGGSPRGGILPGPLPKTPPPKPANTGNRLGPGGGPGGDIFNSPKTPRSARAFGAISSLWNWLGMRSEPREPASRPQIGERPGRPERPERPGQGNQSSLPGPLPGQRGRYLPGHVSRRASARTRSKILAKARGSKNVRLKPESGRLRMSLQVHADPRGRLTRLGYYADLFLKLDPSTDNVPREEEHIGYISTWRLSKEPNQYGHEDHRPWVREWLRSELGGPDDDARPFKDTLRLLYHENGQLRPVNEQAFRNALGDGGNELVFVEMIWIKYKDEATGFRFSHQGLASYALELLYSLMNNGKLPAWFHVNMPIIFVMNPGMPSDNGLSEMWLNEYPKAPGETDQAYCNRITGMLDTTFRSETRYGYDKISDDHRVLAHLVDWRRLGNLEYKKIRDTALEDETVSTLTTGQPEPRSALSSMRC